MDNLFKTEEVEMKSPRLVWMDKHDLIVSKRWNDNLNCWAAWSSKSATVGFGLTEEEALRDWAVKRNVLAWNEEAGPI